MKKKILLMLAIALGITQTTQAQVITTVDCDLMNLVVNVSDTDYVQLYHPGHYLTHPRPENHIAWEITDTQGNIIAQDTLVDESGFGFYHNIPITDTINVSAHLCNDSAIHNGYPVNCLIEDQLYWEVTEIIPGVFTGRWEFINGNVGVDMNSILGVDDIVLVNKKLIKIVDILGREIKKTNQPMFYLYDDGTVEKKIILE